MMPFKDFESVYDIIKQAISKIRGEKFIIERADERYTNLSIWCSRICINIRKAKFCIVDTTGRNPNVFYELGFAHGITKTKTIILTQDISDAPFDIREMGHIIYSEKELPKLRRSLTKAIIELLKEQENDDKELSISRQNDLEEKAINKIIESIKPELIRETIIARITEEINK
jgi:hypothetical protein